jgi:peptidoglycan/xylan/chitin deacetylase (PgdA/CDA1 family)
MTPAQVLQANQEGIQIGSHTISHVNLATQSPAGLAYQVTASKQDLEQLLGHSVLSFCYPSGDFNNAVVAAVQKAGYRDATTTAWPQTRSLANRYIWGRTRISGGESLTTFASSLRAASY